MSTTPSKTTEESIRLLCVDDDIDFFADHPREGVLEKGRIYTVKNARWADIVHLNEFVLYSRCNDKNSIGLNQKRFRRVDTQPGALSLLSLKVNNNNNDNKQQR